MQDNRNDEIERRTAIERSITGRYKTELFSRFTKAITEFELVKEGDRIAVCISGGKDSMLMAKLFQELMRHHKFPFELVFLVMDPGYVKANRELIESNARLLGIPIHIFETRIFDAVVNIEKSPCYLCARMRRGYLYRKAQELGCNKIALGHHYDDVIETVLMGMLNAGQFQAMMPKLPSKNFPGMELIRPMYYIREDDIKRWRDANDLHFLQCACRFTETWYAGRGEEATGSKRLETKQLIRRLKETIPQVEGNLLKSTKNVSLDHVLGYKKDGVYHGFLEEYEANNEPKPSPDVLASESDAAHQPTLEEARALIDTVDPKIRELLMQRLDCSKLVAHAKLESGDLRIYRADREADILKRLGEDVPEDRRAGYLSVVRKIMESSRMYQYGLIFDALGNAFERVEGHEKLEGPTKKVLVRLTRENRPNAMSSILSMIGDYGYNMDRMELVADDPERGVVIFDLLIIGDLTQKHMQKLLFQLSMESTDFAIRECRKS